MSYLLNTGYKNTKQNILTLISYLLLNTRIMYYDLLQIYT